MPLGTYIKTATAEEVGSLISISVNATMCDIPVLEGRTLMGWQGHHLSRSSSPMIFLSTPGKYRENTSIRPGPFLFKTFTVHSYVLPMDAI
jgi:hypothetical protein